MSLHQEPHVVCRQRTQNQLTEWVWRWSQEKRVSNPGSRRNRFYCRTSRWASPNSAYFNPMRWLCSANLRDHCSIRRTRCVAVIGSWLGVHHLSSSPFSPPPFSLSLFLCCESRSINGLRLPCTVWSSPGSQPGHKSPSLSNGPRAEQGWMCYFTCLISLNNFETPRKHVSYFSSWSFSALRKGIRGTNLNEGCLILTNGFRGLLWLAALLLGLWKSKVSWQWSGGREGCLSCEVQKPEEEE